MYHTLEKWSSLSYASHWIVLGTYIFAVLIWIVPVVYLFTCGFIVHDESLIYFTFFVIFYLTINSFVWGKLRKIGTLFEGMYGYYIWLEVSSNDNDHKNGVNHLFTKYVLSINYYNQRGIEKLLLNTL